MLRAGTYEQAIPYERIKSAVLRADDDGHATLLCGARATDLKPRQWRGEADVSFINNHDDSEAARVILYALPLDDELKRLLREHIPVQIKD